MKRPLFDSPWLSIGVVFVFFTFVLCISCAVDEDLNEYEMDVPDEGAPPDVGDGDENGETPEPLCDETYMDPESIQDPINIHCRIERGDFAPPVDETPEILRVVNWNIERGLKVDCLIFEFLNDPTLAEADIITIQEADRGCRRTDYRNVTRELAAALGMNYAFGVEFIELAQDLGEHGNAVLSRFPIGDVRLRRLTDFEQWNLSATEPRYGGRMAIAADVQIAGGQSLQVCSVHIMSDLRNYEVGRTTQVRETSEFLEERPGPVVLGGDFNSFAYYYLNRELSLNELFDRGYLDALAGVPRNDTWTSPGPPRARLDWIFHRGIGRLDGRVLYEDNLSDLSDHLGLCGDFQGMSY